MNALNTMNLPLRESYAASAASIVSVCTELGGKALGWEEMPFVLEDAVRASAPSAVMLPQQWGAFYAYSRESGCALHVSGSGDFQETYREGGLLGLPELAEGGRNALDFAFLNSPGMDIETLRLYVLKLLVSLKGAQHNWDDKTGKVTCCLEAAASHRLVLTVSHPEGSKFFIVSSVLERIAGSAGAGNGAGAEQPLSKVECTVYGLSTLPASSYGMPI